ncbi:MAG: hypothetical protein HY791_16795 [Deltaproteobacteria bacterium]|nr:hypothetical protein [Deltaproteobacteria bacterium]
MSDGAEPRPARTILIVDRDAPMRAQAAKACEPWNVSLASSSQEAKSLTEGVRFDLVIVAFDPNDDDAIGLLRWCRERDPPMIRALWADYEVLPEVIRRRADRVVAAVLARPGTPEGLRQAIRTLLEEEPRADPLGGSPAPVLDLRGAFAELVEQLAKIPGHVIRSRGLAYGDAAVASPTLQLVVPMGPELSAVKRVIEARWARVEPAPWYAPWRRHPVERLFGVRSGLEELFHRSDPAQTSDLAFVGLLPWSAEPRVTVVLGVLPSADPTPWHAVLDELHRLAVSRSATYFLPHFEESTNRSLVEFNREYDWVVTRHYVGPDRRGRTPRLFDRFLVVGRRKRALKGVSELAELLVDRIPRVAQLYLAIFIGLTLIDGVLTHRYVTLGAVRELNPAMRLALSWGPWTFLSVKVSAGALAFHTVSRFHFHAVGRAALLGMLGVYSAVVAYWVWLL